MDLLGRFTFGRCAIPDKLDFLRDQGVEKIMMWDYKKENNGLLYKECTANNNDNALVQNNTSSLFPKPLVHWGSCCLV